MPIRAGISNRQPIPGPALLVYCRVVFVENCHSLTNSFVYDFVRFFSVLCESFDWLIIEENMDNILSFIGSINRKYLG